jgi:hypothetical protein
MSDPMQINVVTSCSFDGYAQYGRACVETFERYWPDDIVMHVVSEDITHLPLHTRRFVGHNLLDSIDCAYFLDRHENSKRVRGFWNGINFSDYQFKYDAYRFCKKVYAIAMIAEKVKTGRLFWMDADCVTHAAVPRDLLERLPPANLAVAHFIRPNYTETGFVGYNLDHPQTHAFIKQVADMYTRDTIFQEKEWHDCWAFDRTRDRMQLDSYAIPFPKGQTHPLVFSELGKYLDHRKGPRKKLDASPEHPIYGKRR